VLCAAALLAGFTAGSRRVSTPLVEEAWRDYASDGHVAAAPAVQQPPAQAAAVVPPAPPPSLEAPPPVAIAPAAPAAAAPAPVAAAPVEVSPAPAPVEPASAPPAPAPEPVFAARPEPPPPPAPPVRPPAAITPPPPPRAARPAPPARSPLGIPVAAALVALLAVGLSLVSLHQDGNGLDGDDGPGIAAAAPAIAGPVSATAAEPPAAEAAPDVDSPLSSAEAAALIDDFRAAYEARDVERLLGLFAADASENGRRGLEAIGAAYRTSLPSFTEVRYSMPRFSVEPRGPRADVRAPFVISYRKTGGASGEVRGQAEWQVERRHGQPRIVALNYRLDAN
jgi:hypothetical protein